MFNESGFWRYVPMSGLDLKEIVAKTGICMVDFLQKINNNGDFSKEEIDSLCGILSIKNPINIFFCS